MFKQLIQNIKLRYKQWKCRKMSFPKLVDSVINENKCQNYPGPIKKVM